MSGAVSLAVQAAGRPNFRGWVRVNCPLCVTRVGKTDRKQSLGYHVVRKFYHCFRCSAAGTLRKPAVEVNEDETKIEDVEDPVGEPESFHLLADDQSLYFEGARAYLRDKRKLDWDLVRKYKIGACSRGRFAGRVVVPIFNKEGTWIWHVGRCWGVVEKTPYLYPSGSREGLLFNHEALLKSTDEPLIGVEGVFDAIAMGDDGVALLGKPSQTLIDVFEISRRPIAMVLDGDALDDGLATALHLRLRGHRAGCVWLPPKVDPDELPRKDVQAAARACVKEFEPVRM